VIVIGVMVPLIGWLLEHHCRCHRARELYIGAEVIFDVVEVTFVKMAKQNEKVHEKHFLVLVLTLLVSGLDLLILKGPESLRTFCPVLADCLRKATQPAGSERVKVWHHSDLVYTFMIHLKKKDGSPLGIDIDNKTGRRFLRIDAIKDGAFKEWNQLFPNSAVRAGDRIVAVNGSEGDTDELIKILKKDNNLKIKIESDWSK